MGRLSSALPPTVYPGGRYSSTALPSSLRERRTKVPCPTVPDGSTNSRQEDTLVGGRADGMAGMSCRRPESHAAAIGSNTEGRALIWLPPSYDHGKLHSLTGSMVLVAFVNIDAI